MTSKDDQFQNLDNTSNYQSNLQLPGKTEIRHSIGFCSSEQKKISMFKDIYDVWMFTSMFKGLEEQCKEQTTSAVS